MQTLFTLFFTLICLKQIDISQTFKFTILSGTNIFSFCVGPSEKHRKVTKEVGNFLGVRPSRKCYTTSRMDHKSYKACLHVFLMEAGVMTFVTDCTTGNAFAGYAFCNIIDSLAWLFISQFSLFSD